MNIEVVPYDCTEELVNVALRRAMTEEKWHSVAFAGEIDTIQSILSILLKDLGFAIDKLNMDTCEYDMYQLTIDEDGFISVVPIRNRYGNYFVVDADFRYVSDEMPLSYCNRLDTCGKEYIVFGFDYDDSDDDELSDEEAEDLVNNAEFAVIYSKYSQLPKNYQQLIDMILDWDF